MNLTALDKVFSTFIRQRDADANGLIRCISCGKIVPWKESDCGHYINRKHLSTRWDEQNCNAQCRSCNRFNEGSMHGYANGLRKKYGEDVHEKLFIKHFNTVKITQAEVNILTNYFKKLSNVNKI